MTPRTRTSNQDASYKVYYSKKVPRQAQFPHRRKLVRRRPQPSVQDGQEKRQMKFLPERMKQASLNNEQDSGEQETDEEPTMQMTINTTETPINGSLDKKRKSDGIRGESGSEDEPVSTLSKRRRRTAPLKEDSARTLRRQSTMTQLADGRRPSIGEDEPDFHPANRRSRVSWGGSGVERDKKQRTLTQMIPGMGRLSKEELEELSDMDADLEDDGTDNNNASPALVEQGLLEVDMSARSYDKSHSVKSQGEEEASLPAALQPQTSAIVQSMEATSGNDKEEDYQPTQYIEAPILRIRQTPRRKAAQQQPIQTHGSQKSAKSRFSLLSTPEKRRIFEIPSSQSPAESVLSTQVSPQKSTTSVLRERTNNVIIVTETPSKRRQVTFKEPSLQSVPLPRLRKFESTIQDSEDEESDLEQDINDQDDMDRVHQAVHGQAIGTETQLVLGQIDRACADKEEGRSNRCEFPEEMTEPKVRQRPYQPSPELGESWVPVLYDDDDGPEFASYWSSLSGAKSQSIRNVGASNQMLPVLDSNNAVSQQDFTEDTQGRAKINDIPSTPPAMQLHPNDDLPSTPMVLKDDTSDDEEEPELMPTPKLTVQRTVVNPPSTLVHQSADLDGEPVQVPRSPSADRETQQSHSSKAEQQLQHGWLSYSQYVHVRAPGSSSMHAVPDAHSYNATPHISNNGELESPSARMQHSQATTVDELTPKKNRTQRVTSAHTTPHRNSKSQPFMSPEKPPSLFIPSSFPSPSKIAMEGWSSPVVPRTQNVYGNSQALGSLEDFSIPLPPPIEDD
ncbi:hypothetical protein G6514_002289 [Epicoccum nigrum]|nr:hypothetical protein G6514_002289 [Epicoccum nigrum]